MDDGDRYNSDGNDSSQAFHARLPAIIPFRRPPVVAVLHRHVSFSFRSLIIPAVLGAVIAGTLAAAWWPWDYRSRTSGVVATLPGPSTGTPSAAAGPAEVTTEVTRVALGGATLTTARPAAAEPVTTDMATTGPVTTGPDGTEPIRTEPATAPRDSCQIGQAGPQLVLNSPRKVLRSDEPASLGLTVVGLMLDGASDGAQLIICGFAANSMFSVGRAVDENTWAVPVSMIADVTIMPPRGFVGRMDLAVTLMNTDKSLADRKTVYLQWLPQAQPGPRRPTASPRNDFAGADDLLTYATYLKGAGNLAEARQVFARVAGMGDSRGAFMLAESYDPIALAKRQLLPADSDLEQARIWYRKASDLGSPDAPGRLERLTTW
jgi:hypothetical protein